jgi:hypothetical protein
LDCEHQPIATSNGFGEWLEGARKIRAELEAKYGDILMSSAVEILEETREERLKQILGEDDAEIE